MFKQDYIVRQIELLAQGIARIFFHREDVAYIIPEQETHYTTTDRWYRRILELLHMGRYNDAESLLFDEMDAGNRDHLAVALDFYGKLNALTDTALEAGNFSRAEIEDGLRDAARRFGAELETLRD